MADVSERIKAELKNVDGVLARMPSCETLPELLNWNRPGWLASLQVSRKAFSAVLSLAVLFPSHFRARIGLSSALLPLLFVLTDDQEVVSIPYETEVGLVELPVQVNQQPPAE